MKVLEAGRYKQVYLIFYITFALRLRPVVLVLPFSSAQNLDGFFCKTEKKNFYRILTQKIL